MHTLHRSTSSGSIDRRTSARTRFGAARLLGAGAVALVASVVATFAIREIAVAIVDVPTVFTPLRLSSTLSLAILGTVAAVAVCFALNALSRGSVELFRVIAPLALVASFIPDVAIWADGAYGGAARASTVLPLMGMHLAVGAICLIVLPGLGRARSPEAITGVAVEA